MKIESADLPHKTEAGGVLLGLSDEDAVRSAYDEIVRNARRFKVDAAIDGLIIQEMAKGGLELVVGLKRDPVFGMVIMVGLGGVFVEVLRDVVFRKAPITPAQAEDMLRSLQGAAMLDGVRGAPPVNMEALTELIAAVSRFGAGASERVAELDLNPVLAGPERAVAVDWLLIQDRDH